LIEFLEMLLQSIVVVGNGDTGSTSSSSMGHPGIIPGMPGY